MKITENSLKKYNVVIPKLFQIILNLPEEKQLILLQYAEELLIKERRAFIRKTCSIPVSYATYDRVYSNTIKNISQKGVFIETQRPLFVGEELILSFSIAGALYCNWHHPKLTWVPVFFLQKPFSKVSWIFISHFFKSSIKIGKAFKS